jgi:hypothetical protein
VNSSSASVPPQIAFKLSEQLARAVAGFRDASNALYQPLFVPLYLTCPALPLIAAQVENYPLYAMVGIACGLAVYTPIRHLTKAADIA